MDWFTVSEAETDHNSLDPMDRENLMSGHECVFKKCCKKYKKKGRHCKKCPKL